jgi:hypothetical protein
MYSTRRYNIMSQKSHVLVVQEKQWYQQQIKHDHRRHHHQKNALGSAAAGIMERFVILFL